jgi:hypothetical protein
MDTTCRRINTAVHYYETPTGRKGEHRPPLKIRVLLAVFRDITQSSAVIPYHHSLHNNTDGFSSQLLRSGSLKSRILLDCYVY